MTTAGSLFCFFYSGDEWSQIAYVTFKDSQGAETALLLSVCALGIFYYYLLIIIFFYFL